MALAAPGVPFDDPCVVVCVIDCAPTAGVRDEVSIEPVAVTTLDATGDAAEAAPEDGRVVTTTAAGTTPAGVAVELVAGAIATAVGATRVGNRPFCMPYCINSPDCSPKA